MSKEGPILVIEDDLDDQGLLIEIFKKINLSNEVIYFFDSVEALNYLHETEVSPFLIFSDVNMPKINGFELRAKLRASEKISLRCIPYLIFTSGANSNIVYQAYEASIQGFFIKPMRIKDLEDTIRKVIDYWKLCITPEE